MRLFLWKLYTWIDNIINSILEFCPISVRIVYFRVMFGSIGEHSDLIDYHTYFRYPWKMKIGSHVAINRGCCFLASAHSDNKYDIVIGNHCVFAPNVKLLTGGHNYHYLDLPDTFGQIKIGDYVWIGEGAIVMHGVKIGTGGVIGAGSIVTKDIPPWTVWAGNPARQIGIRDVNCDKGGLSI